MAKSAFSKVKALFTSKLDINLKKEQIMCYIWRIAFFGAENWTIPIVDLKCL